MNDHLSDTIIQTLEKRGISPRPRWHFLLKRRVLWFVSCLSVLLGGIAISVIIFVFFDHDTDARVYLHENLAQDLLLSIPYVWLVSLAILVALTRLAVLHTEHGYRYGVSRVITLTLLASVALGLLFDAFDVGQNVDEFLNETIPYYDSIVYTSRDAWSQPEKGLLGGTLLSTLSSSEIHIRDFRNREWRVDVSKIEQGDLPPQLVIGQIIKIVGDDMGQGTFRANQLFMWAK